MQLRSVSCNRQYMFVWGPSPESPQPASSHPQPRLFIDAQPCIPDETYHRPGPNSQPRRASTSCSKRCSSCWASSCPWETPWRKKRKRVSGFGWGPIGFRVGASDFYLWGSPPLLRLSALWLIFRFGFWLRRVCSRMKESCFLCQVHSKQLMESCLPWGPGSRSFFIWNSCLDM